jgi:AcrR family transcriptional regulator
MGKGEQTRQLIVDRALSMAQRLGLEQVTLGVLADELDLSKSGLFAHFKSKEQLQLEVVKEVVDRFSHTVILPALKVERGAPRVQQLFEGYLEWIRSPTASTESGCILMAMSYEYDDRPGPVRDALVKAQHDWIDSVARVAKSGIGAGSFRADLDPKLFAFEFDGILQSFHRAFKLLQHNRAESMARKALARLLTEATTT